MASDESESILDPNMVFLGSLDQQMPTGKMQAKHKDGYRETYEDRLEHCQIITAQNKKVSHRYNLRGAKEKRKVPFLFDYQVAIASEACIPCKRINSVSPLGSAPFPCFISGDPKGIRDTGYSICAHCLIYNQVSKCKALADGKKPEYVNDVKEKEEREQASSSRREPKVEFALKTEMKAEIDGLRSATKELVKEHYQQIQAEEKTKKGKPKRKRNNHDDDDDDD